MVAQSTIIDTCGLCKSTSHPVANQLATELFMRKERRRLQARHIWRDIDPDWPMLKERVWTRHATGLPREVLHKRLFLHDFAEASRWLENSYKGPDVYRVKWQWKSCREWFSAQAIARSPWRWDCTPYLQQLDQQDVLSWQWVAYHERIVVQVWHTKQGVFRRKLPPDVRDNPMRGQPGPQVMCLRVGQLIIGGIMDLGDFLVTTYRTTYSNAPYAYLYSCG